MQDIRSLTGLRFVLASMIVLFHLEGVYLLESRIFPTITLGSAVAFFFCLSGFVMQHAYRDRIKKMGFLEFYVRRFFRLWPVHVLGILVYVVLFHPQGLSSIRSDFSFLELGAIIFLVQAWCNEQTIFLGINGPAWSISVELFFYLMFPFISKPVRVRPLLVLATVSSFTVAYLCVASALHTSDIFKNEIGLGSVVPLSRFLEFTIGALSYELFNSSNRFMRALKNHGAAVLTFIELALLSLVMGAMSAAYNLKVFVDATNQDFVVVAVWLANFVATPIFCLCVVVFSIGGGYVAKILSMRLFVLLGKISFAQYLLHQLIIFYFRDHIADTSMPIWLQGIAFISSVFIASYLAYKFVELPGIAVSRTLVRKIGNRSD